MANKLSRRKFLQYLAGSASGFAFLSPNTVFAFPHKYKRDTGDFLSFAELEGLGPEINVEFMGREFVALHEERELPVHMIDEMNRDYLQWLMREMVRQQGMKWDESDKLVWTYQYYGICDHSSECFKLLNYSKSAQDFLYSSVSGLLETNIDWHVLTDDFDYIRKSQNHFNGYIGRHTYLVSRVSLESADGEAKEYGLVSASPVNRAINYITSNGPVLNTSLMYIIPGNTSIVSPFSEVLHLTTHAPSRRLAQQLGEKQGSQKAEQTSHMISETITESAALIMAQNYLNNYRYDDSMKFVYSHANYLGSRYSLMPDTLAYMNRHGVQKTLDRFTNNPLYLVNDLSYSLVDPSS